VVTTLKSEVNLKNTLTYGLCLKQGTEYTYKTLIYLMTLRKITVGHSVNTAKLMNILPDKYFKLTFNSDGIHNYITSE
jgi:hypothetical protein